MLDKLNVLLLVEDDDNDIIITRRKLDRSSAKINEVVIARTLEETKSVLQIRSDIDVVLLDLNLPDSRGLDTVDGVRSVFNGIIIVLTSIDDEVMGVKAIRQGADEYLVKTYLNERLLSDSIYHAIERRKRWEHVGKVHSTLDKLSELTAN